MIHWAVPASMSKSDMMTGSAGDMTVWLSSARKAPRTTTPTVRICAAVTPPCGAAAAAAVAGAAASGARPWFSVVCDMR